jgi:hypothetical protein
MRGLNRVLTAEAWEVHANPPDRTPSAFGGNLRLGVRTLGEENLWTRASSRPFFEFDVVYGNPFRVAVKKPFDHFRFGMRINFGDPEHIIGLIESEGLIAAADVNRTETTHHMVGAFLHFDYLDNDAYTYGGQSLSASYVSFFRASERFKAVTSMHLQGIILGASKSDYFSLSGREYDYGPGVGYKLGAEFRLGRWDFLSLWHTGHWIHSINGNKADHYVNLTRVIIEFPITSSIGGGLNYELYLADRSYDYYPDVHDRYPELRLYFMWRGSIWEDD